MSERVQRFIQVDEDGYFKMEDLRVADLDTGRAWFKSMRMDGLKPVIAMDGPSGTDMVIVESFDAPLVAKNISRDGGSWTLDLPYGHSEAFDPSALTIDEWDRFHGICERGIPFVFSRSAQATFFNLLDEYDDDSIMIDGKNFVLGPWLQENADAGSSKWWSGFYQTGDAGWDLGGPHPALALFVPGLKLHRSRILVLGAGRGHDAAWFAKQGHIVTAVDYSEDAIAQAKELYGSVDNLTFLKADALGLPPSMDRSFDVIFEHTLYCAIPPSRRNELAKSWRRALVETGHLMGVFFVNDKPFGPPFGGSEWELRARLSKTFLPLYWQRLRLDHGKSRSGTELFLYAQKLSVV
ncbi:MAG: methyltransferase domain-containing protein [Bdellovibrionota bacterium]